MDKVLKPEHFDASPNSAEAAKQWPHWLITFENFLAALPQQGLNKLRVLVNYVSPDVYELIGEAETYEEAIRSHMKLFAGPDEFMKVILRSSPCLLTSCSKPSHHLPL